MGWFSWAWGPVLYLFPKTLNRPNPPPQFRSPQSTPSSDETLGHGLARRRLPLPLRRRPCPRRILFLLRRLAPPLGSSTPRLPAPLRPRLRLRDREVNWNGARLLGRGGIRSYGEWLVGYDPCRPLAAMAGSPAAVVVRLTGHSATSVRACCELSQGTLFCRTCQDR